VYLHDDEDLKKRAPAATSIAFYDANGQPLPCEIAGYSSELGLLDAWVLQPTLLPTATTFTLEYGEGITSHCMPTTVWPTAEWRGVWHLAETLSGVAHDSTENHLDVTATTGTGVSAPDPTPGGMAGYGLQFKDYPSADQLCRMAGEPAMEVGTKSFTLEVWVNQTVMRASYDMAIYKGGSSAGTPGYDLELGMVEWRANVRDTTDASDHVNFTSDSGPFTGQWTHLAFVIDRDAPSFTPYVNGLPISAAKTLVALGDYSTPERFCLGNSNRPMTGFLDEARLHNVKRDAEWIRETYLNLAAREVFMNVSAP
jgi:hypothetical protein